MGNAILITNKHNTDRESSLNRVSSSFPTCATGVFMCVFVVDFSKSIASLKSLSILKGLGAR